MHGLANLRVIDFSSWIAGPYASKLYADGGADVIKVESLQGDPMRQWATTQIGRDSITDDGAFFKYLNGGKRSVQGAPNDPEILALIENADLVIEDFELDSAEYAQLDIPGLRARFPHLVVLSISPYGRTGPYANRPATEFTIQAESGSTSGRGLPTDAPIVAGGRVTDFVGATYAAVAALSAIRGVQDGLQGEHVDFSLLEVMNIASTIYLDLAFSLMDRPEVPGPFRQVEAPSIEPTLDGWVGFNTNSRQQFTDFLVLIQRPDLLEDEELASAWTRQYRMEEWNKAVREWTTKQTTDDIIEVASLLRIPVAPVHNGETVIDHPQFKARGIYEKNPGGNFLQPRPPYTLNGKRVSPLKAAPTLGEHSTSIEARSPHSNTTPALSTADLPLKGLRVLDATAWWAGPSATQMLGTLGADIIHLEAMQRLDGARSVIAAPGDDHWWENSHLYHGGNFNKRNLTLNLNSDKGMALFKDLIGQCDILVENYSPRVMDNFGLSWDVIRALNPKIVFVRMPAFGLDGPWRDNVGFAQTMEQMSGMAWVTGHPHDQPRIQRGPCDPLAGMHAAFAILVGLAERDASGEGQCIEAAMIEGALNAAAEQAIEFTAYNHLMHREGNRSPYAAPQGLYAVQGEDNWLALSIATDAQWQALVEVLGSPEWARSKALSTLAGRRAAHDAIDEVLCAWAKDQDYDSVVQLLINQGIPAAKLADGRAAYCHPQFVARSFHETVDHPYTGKHPIPSMPFKFSSRHNQPWIKQYAPTLGQHNHEILSELLSLSTEEIAALEAENVIGSSPENF